MTSSLNVGKTVTTLYTHCGENVSQLSHPTLQASESELAQELARGLEEQVECKLKRQLCNATIKGSVPTAIVDTGASASCVKPIDEQPTVSECGRFKLSGNIFTKSGVKSVKTFQMALGHVAKATDVVHLNLPLRREATEAHIVLGLMHNLLSMNKLAKAGYEAHFKDDTVKFYDTRGTQQSTTRKAVLEVWYVPQEGLWRIPLKEAVVTNGRVNNNNK